MFFLRRFRKTSILLDSPGTAWSPAGTKPFLPERCYPAARPCPAPLPCPRAPRPFVQGCRHRSPAWNRPRRSVRRRFDILPGFRRRLGLFRREKPRRRSGIRRRPSGIAAGGGFSEAEQISKRNIGRGLPFRIRCGKTAGKPAAGWKPRKAQGPRRVKSLKAGKGGRRIRLLYICCSYHGKSAA